MGSWGWHDWIAEQQQWVTLIREFKLKCFQNCMGKRVCVELFSWIFWMKTLPKFMGWDGTLRIGRWNETFSCRWSMADFTDVSAGNVNLLIHFTEGSVPDSSERTVWIPQTWKFLQSWSNCVLKWGVVRFILFPPMPYTLSLTLDLYDKRVTRERVKRTVGTRQSPNYHRDTQTWLFLGNTVLNHKSGEICWIELNIAQQVE